MIHETEMIEIVDNKPYERPVITKFQRFVDFKLWMTLVNKLNRDDLTTKLFPYEMKIDDGTTVKPNIFILENDVPMLIVEADHSAIKLEKYLASGVPEYWIVNQTENTVTTYHLYDNNYISTVYRSGDAVPTLLDDKLAINVDKLFRIDYTDEIN